MLESKLQKESELLTKIAVSALTGMAVEQNDFDDVNVKRLYKLSKFHELHSLAAYVIKRDKIELSEEYTALFENAREVCIFRTASQINACEIIKQKLCENKVHFIVLKGSVIRNLYPVEDMRTSGDVDILYNEKELSIDGLENVMMSAGFKKTKGSRTVDTFSDGNSVFEMHRQLGQDKELKYIPENLINIFDGELSATEYEMEMTHEDFYVFHIVHMARHFVAHGCGIRGLLDMYLLLQKYGDSYNKDVLRDRFEEIGLVKFEEQIRSLVVSLFGGNELSELQRNVYMTLMFSGIYGNTEQSAANQHVKSKNGKGGKTASLVKTAFLPLENMKVRYPVLKKAPFLLPVMWCVRVADVVINKTGKIKKSVRDYTEVDEKKVEKTERLYKELGL